MADYYIHKLLIVKFDQMQLIIAFTEDQKAKVFDAATFRKLQDIKFPSDYGVAKVSKEGRELRESSDARTITNSQAKRLKDTDNYSTSGYSRLDSRTNVMQVGMQDYMADIQLESIAEKTSSTKIARTKTNIGINAGEKIALKSNFAFQKRLALQPDRPQEKRPKSTIDASKVAIKRELDRSVISQPAVS
jgi:hypothetical protein